MATGAKMSYNHYQSGKFGTLPQTSQKDVEVTHDMHLKMSKKIAQLTKVIYALNTKNDEHESILQALRDQHEEEIQQVISDTRQKVAVYKERLDEESDHRATIESLQARLAEHQSQKASVEEQFACFKAEVQEKQEREKENYSNRLFDMSHEVLTAKKEFEEHIDRFNSWKERVTAEHATALAELESKHQTELEDLRCFQRDQDDTWLNQCAKIEDKFSSQISDLKMQLQNMEEEKVRLQEEYTVKLEKAQAFYEKELEALKHNQSTEHVNELERMRKELDRLKSNYTSSDKELRQQIDRLVRQLADTEDALEHSKQQQQILQAELSNRDTSSSELAKQMQDLRDELAAKKTSLHNVETELTVSKQHCADLVDELRKKSTLLGELEAHNIQKDGIISTLRAEIEELKQKLTRLNAERSSLQSQQEHLSSEVQAQLQNLRQALEDMTVEKETLKQRFEKQVQNLKDDLVNQEQALKEETRSKLAEADQKHLEIREQDRKTAAEVLVSTKEELNTKYESEVRKVTSEKETVQEELERIKAELNDKLEIAEREVARLEAVVKESESGLGAASGQLANLKDATAQLRAELDKTRTELKTSKTNAASLQAELDKLRILHEGKVAEMETVLKKKIEQCRQELDAKWTETMKLESSKLRHELSAQKEDEKRAALSQLSRLKEEEIQAVRAGLDSQVQHLKDEIEELKLKLEQDRSATDAEKAKWEFELEQEKARLKQDLLEAANDYAAKIEAMEKMHANQLARLEEQKEQEKMELEAALKKKHLEEMQAQVAAHKVAMESASQLKQQQHQEALAQLQARHQQEIVELRKMLDGEKFAELESMKQSHGAEIRAARMELDRAVEISRQKERDHQIQLEELKTEITHREQHINNLRDQLQQIQDSIDRFKNEIEAKNLEIRQAQKQAVQQLKVQEDKLGREKERALENLNAEHLREQQQVLAQFNAAQDMLKDKISELQIELEEAHLRYSQRESRPEDLELIESLRAEVDEREARVKDLIDEKRFYQLELVNRETNFNKVFNTTPNVGVLNPFAKPPKKGEKAPKRLVVPNGSNGSSMNNSLSGSHQRLDPLPGSPMHDGKLNPTKPLPQPNFTKKFVK